MTPARAALLQIPRIPTHVLVLGRGEQTVLVHVPGRRRAVLGRGAARVLRLCNGSRTVAEVGAALARQYQIPEELALSDTLELLLRLNGANLVEMVDQREAFPLEDLVVELTERCNLRCCHCIFGYRVGRTRQLAGPVLRSLLTEAGQMGVRSVYLSGGEPTLHPDFPGVVHQLNDLGVFSVVLTNGTVTTPTAMEAIRQAGEVRVSLDGTRPDTHDRIRGEGTFQRTVTFIRKLVQAGANVAVTFTACKWNEADWPHIQEFVAGLGVAGLYAGEVVIWGRARDFERELGLSPAEVVRFRLALSRARTSAGHGSALLRVNSEDEPQSLHRDMCVAGRQKCTVLPDGRVIPCGLLDQPEMTAGNIHDASLRQIWDQSPVFQALRSLSVAQFDQCSSCDYRFVCGGGCRAYAYLQHNGSLYGPPCPSDCAWRKILIRALMNEYQETAGRIFQTGSKSGGQSV